MRKANAILSAAIIALFLLHSFIGAGEMIGFIEGGLMFGKVVAFILLAVIAIHVFIGLKLTCDTLIAMKRSGVGAFRENKLFWIRRISGFAIVIFLTAHIIVFLGSYDEGIFVLTPFLVPELITAVLFVAALAVHILTDIKPLTIALGLKSGKALTVMLVISVFLLFSAAAFTFYFVRWLAWS